MPLTDDQINSWAKPPSDTESEKCLNAISQVTDALRATYGNAITIIQQGSHRNRTNIRIDSDVDLAVVHNSFNFSDTNALSPADKALYEANWTPASLSFAQFKTDVQSILATKFGAANVQRKNKCVRVLGNTNRVNADVVPAFEFHRMRTHNQTSAQGIGFLTDAGVRIESYPEQHYANGVAKNDATGRAFKSSVRILKHVRNHLVDIGTIPKELMSSHFLECLVWNAPNTCFANSSYRADANAVTSRIWNDMRDGTWNNYAEVSDLRWLFRGGQRNPADAERFTLEAWRQFQK